MRLNRNAAQAQAGNGLQSLEKGVECLLVVQRDLERVNFNCCRGQLLGHHRLLRIQPLDLSLEVLDRRLQPRDVHFLTLAVLLGHARIATRVVAVTIAAAAVIVGVGGGAFVLTTLHDSAALSRGRRALRRSNNVVRIIVFIRIGGRVVGLARLLLLLLLLVVVVGNGGKIFLNKGSRSNR